MADRIYLDSEKSEIEASEQFSAELLQQVRDNILDLGCIEKIYPRAGVAGRVARVASAAASTVQSMVEQVFTSDMKEEDPGDSSLENMPDAHASAQEVDEKSAPRSFFKKQHALYVRVGTTPGANVPESARQVSRLVHHHLGDDVAVNVDVVNV